ncbi:MAG TPA: CU044_2847 family protein [Desulfosarcina sp.]|nr:CU044_2847 family protein [Desulfosarcina sp.]
MRRMLEYDMDGEKVYVEADDDGSGTQRVARGGEPVVATDSKFQEAIARIRPAAEAVLNTFREMNTPDEIGLEFGVKFNAKAGAVFASVDSEATFKVSLKWTNPKGTPKAQEDGAVQAPAPGAQTPSPSMGEGRGGGE